MKQASWYTEWCEPIVVALYERDRRQIADKLAVAKTQIAEGKLDPAATACLRYQVAYLEYQAMLVVREPQLLAVDLESILDLLSSPGEVPAAEGLRRRLYLQVRVLLDRAGVTSLESNEFDQLFEQLPQYQHTTEVWHYIASWAFKYNRAEYLAQAYEYAVSNARGFNVAWTWQRVHFMWQLAMGKATQHDLVWLIKRAAILQQLLAIKKVFWARARENNLITDRIEVLFQQRELELSGQQSQRVNELLRPHLAAASRHGEAARKLEVTT